MTDNLYNIYENYIQKNNMKNLQEILKEDRKNTINKGCLMAMVPKNISEHIINFGKKIINDEDLYIKDGEFGREKESHVTIRYGFTKDINELDIRQLINHQKPFIVTFTKLDKFETEEFDVIILRSENSIIKRWHELSGVYPNESEFSDYKQHMTIAYVKKGNFNLKKDLELNIPITNICYSPISGEKSVFNLKENMNQYDVNSKIERLRTEWDKLDALGNQYVRQREISDEIERLETKIERPVNPTTQKSKDLWSQLKTAIQ